jgi:hypothetical protein
MLTRFKFMLAMLMLLVVAGMSSPARAQGANSAEGTVHELFSSTSSRKTRNGCDRGKGHLSSRWLYALA